MRHAALTVGLVVAGVLVMAGAMKAVKRWTEPPGIYYDAEYIDGLRDAGARDGSAPYALGPSTIAAYTFRGVPPALDPGDLLLAIQNSDAEPLATARQLEDGGYELRVIDASAVRVVMPDGGACR